MGVPMEEGAPEPARSATPRRGRARRLLAAAAASLLLAFTTAQIGGFWYARAGASEDERGAALAGDDVVPDPRAAYTLGIDVAAPPSAIWPWLVQMGQGRAGFYTYEWVENLLGADIHNADRIVPELQRLAVGDRVRLTPDPYLGGPGQFMTVAALDPPRALVFRQTLPNGSESSWALVLEPRDDGTTRLLSRRRTGPPTAFDFVVAPGYLIMDRGVLRGIRARAEASVRP